VTCVGAEKAAEKAAQRQSTTSKVLHHELAALVNKHGLYALPVMQVHNFIAAHEKAIRAKIVASLKSTPWYMVDCDVNKDDILLCIKHGTTLREAYILEGKPLP
jgi:hypothetical protein